MRYLLLIQINPDAEALTDPDERLAEGMGKLLEDMTKAGVLLDTAGLRPIEEATRIRLADGEQTVIDGPFTESKEVIGGYCLLQARSKEEAVEWASRFLALHGPDWEMGMEIRQVRDPPSSTSAVTTAAPADLRISTALRLDSEPDAVRSDCHRADVSPPSPCQRVRTRQPSARRRRARAAPRPARSKVPFVDRRARGL